MDRSMLAVASILFSIIHIKHIDISLKIGDHIKHFPLGTSWILRLLCKSTKTHYSSNINLHDGVLEGSIKYNANSHKNAHKRSLSADDNKNEEESYNNVKYERKSSPTSNITIPQSNDVIVHKYCPIFILCLTFFIYTAFHASRRPISVVKSALHHPANCSNYINIVTPSHPTKFHLRSPYYFDTHDIYLPPNNSLSSHCDDWAPFDGPNYNEMFGALDMAYLFSYALAMFVSGHLAEHLPLRHFLVCGMIGSGALTALFGAGYFLNIHSAAYYFVVQVIGGAFQSSGWPCVVTCMGSWFGKRKKGLIFGIWNSHTSVGNIIGGLIAALWVNGPWGWSFVVPGLILIFMALPVALFLVPSPEEFEECYAGLALTAGRKKTKRDAESLITDHKQKKSDSLERGLPSTSSFENSCSQNYYDSKLVDERSHLLSANSQSDDIVPLLGSSPPPLKSTRKKPIGIRKALRVPGVLEFSLCLFFAKAVSYTFLFWLPNYISASSSLDPGKAAILASIFDFGGILGGIVAGYISDRTEASATVCAFMLALSCPLIYYYHAYGHVNYATNICLLFITGHFVNGPYALITTAVSAELGNKIGHSQHAKALATITAIIDGSGSLGAAIGPLIAGLVATKGWWNVFAMLIISDIFAILFLIRLSYREIKLVYQIKKERII
ncbi:unnamed protein product [Gordionus sp. m RMFG-2023]